MTASKVLTAVYHAAALRGLLPASTAATPFAIVGGPRSGSTMLQTLLDSHPNIICMHELLKTGGGTPAFRRYCLGKRKQLIELRAHNMAGFIQELLSLPHPPWIKALGFKALYTQPREEAIRYSVWESLRCVPDMRIIWISRNPVRCVVSFAIAKETKAWIGKKMEQVFAIDPDYMLRRLALEEKKAEEVRSYLKGGDILELSYEKIQAQQGEELTRVQKFLNLPLKPLQTSLKRQNPQPLDRLLSNFVELQQALRGTPWYDCLGEDDQGSREL